MQIRRGFVDIAEGQLHYRTCGDASLPPLVMVHGSPGSSYSLVPLMRHLAAERRIIAIDTPGNGDSTPSPEAEPEIGDLADAHRRAIGALGLQDVDLYGYHTGTAICAEIAIAEPERVRKIVMEGVSVFQAGARAELFDNDHAPDIPPDLDGTHLMTAWTMVRDAHLFWPWWRRDQEARRPLGLPPAAHVTGEAIEVLKSSRTYFRSYRAALRYPKRDRLPLVRRPVLVAACPSDQLFGFMEQAAALLPDARSAVTPDPHTDADLAGAAAIMLDFLR